MSKGSGGAVSSGEQAASIAQQASFTPDHVLTKPAAAHRATSFRAAPNLIACPTCAAPARHWLLAQNCSCVLPRLPAETALIRLVGGTAE